MTDKAYVQELQNYAKNVEKGENGEISSILQANFEAIGHIMLIEEKKIAKFKMNLKLQKENALLEKVDLTDYWNILEYGRANKTR